MFEAKLKIDDEEFEIHARRLAKRLREVADTLAARSEGDLLPEVAEIERIEDAVERLPADLEIEA